MCVLEINPHVNKWNKLFQQEKWKRLASTEAAVDRAVLSQSCFVTPNALINAQINHTTGFCKFYRVLKLCNKYVSFVAEGKIRKVKKINE